MGLAWRCAAGHHFSSGASFALCVRNSLPPHHVIGIAFLGGHRQLSVTHTPSDRNVSVSSAIQQPDHDLACKQSSALLSWFWWPEHSGLLNCLRLEHSLSRQRMQVGAPGGVSPMLLPGVELGIPREWPLLEQGLHQYHRLLQDRASAARQVTLSGQPGTALP